MCFWRLPRCRFSEWVLGISRLIYLSTSRHFPAAWGLPCFAGSRAAARSCRLPLFCSLALRAKGPPSRVVAFSHCIARSPGFTPRPPLQPSIPHVCRCCSLRTLPTSTPTTGPLCLPLFLSCPRPHPSCQFLRSFCLFLRALSRAVSYTPHLELTQPNFLRV